MGWRSGLVRCGAVGIICWKLDRLARNPVDGGSIIWAIKQHDIKVMTQSQSYAREDDNIILMYIEFGMAQKYVDDLSKNDADLVFTVSVHGVTLGSDWTRSSSGTTCSVHILRNSLPY